MPYPKPVRADHRYIEQMLNTTFKSDRVSATPSQMRLLCEVFGAAGGSWERLFRGSVEDVETLRKVARAAIQRGLLTTQPSWD